VGKDDSSHGLIEPQQKAAQRENSDQKKEVVFNVVQGYTAPEPATSGMFHPAVSSRHTAPDKIFAQLACLPSREGGKGQEGRQ
jgi:hypothetical protein